MAAMVLLALRGTPFLYAGEELGLEDAVVSEGQRMDPGDRDGCRAPIPWDAGPGHGWPGEPWLPWPPAPEANSVAGLRSRHDSILHLYRRLLAARRSSPALHAGTWRLLDAPPHVLAFERECDGDVRRVVANFGEKDVPAVSMGDWVIEVATHQRREATAWDGLVPVVEALVLRPV